MHMDRYCFPLTWQKIPLPFPRRSFFPTPLTVIRAKVLIWAHFSKSISLKFIMQYQYRQESHYGLAAGKLTSIV